MFIYKLYINYYVDKLYTLKAYTKQFLMSIKNKFFSFYIQWIICIHLPFENHHLPNLMVLWTVATVRTVYTE